MLLADAPTRSVAPCKRSSDHWSPRDDAIIFLVSAPMFTADASCFLDSAAKVFDGAIRMSVDAPIFLFSASTSWSPAPGFSSGASSLCSRATLDSIVPEPLTPIGVERFQKEERNAPMRTQVRRRHDAHLRANGVCTEHRAVFDAIAGGQQTRDAFRKISALCVLCVF